MAAAPVDLVTVEIRIAQPAGPRPRPPVSRGSAIAMTIVVRLQGKTQGLTSHLLFGRTLGYLP